MSATAIKTFPNVAVKNVYWCICAFRQSSKEFDAMEADAKKMGSKDKFSNKVRRRC